MANTTDQNWDETEPNLTTARKAGALEITSLRGAVRDRLAKEHVEPDAAGVGGEHLEGSARAYHQASAPANLPDGSATLGASDDGRLWVDSDDGSLYYWTGSAWAAAAAGGTIPNTKYCRVNQGNFNSTVANSFQNTLTSLSEASGQASDFETLQSDGIDLQTGTYIIEAEFHTVGAYLSDAKLIFTTGTVTPGAGVSMLSTSGAPFAAGFYRIKSRFNVTVAGRLQFQIKVTNTGIVMDAAHIHIEKIA